MEKLEGAKILLIDIETAPNLGYTWGRYEQNVIKIVREWYILTFSAKWLKGKHITRGLPDYREFGRDKQSDKGIVRELHTLLNEADIVVGQNSDEFDLKKINSRFSFWNLPPPSPYKTVDTLKVARRYFSFSSNKLDDLSSFWKFGNKIKTDFDLWEGCMAGNTKAFKRMKRYNKMDILLLEKAYLKVLPWIQNHPNLGMYSTGLNCPKCGSTELEKRGFYANKTTKYQRVRCINCGGWARAALNFQEIRPLIGV